MGMRDELRPLLAPQSVAVIGASRRRGTIGGEIFFNLLRVGYQGVLYPIHPEAPAIQAVKAYPSIAAVPEVVDLAVVAVPSQHVLQVARDCAAAGVRAMVVISAGFKEAGEEGARREQALRDIARGANMRLVGPNCLGILNTDPAVCLDATFAPTWPQAGGIGFMTQSGALGVAILDHGRALNLGVSTFVSVGNRADVSANDLLEYWEEDPATEAILLYLETFGNPRRFNRIARRVARRKPILAVKSGRSAAGRRATDSHTGSLAGVDIAADALFWQTGVIRVDTLEELFNAGMLLVHQPVPKGRRVAIVTNAGGPGILAADACEAQGLEVAQLSDHTQAQLRAFLPAEASVKNPVDMIASASPASYEAAIRVLLDDPGIDSLIAIFVPPIITRAQEVAEAIKAGAAHSPKTVLVNFLGSHGVPESLRSLQEASFPSYAFPEAAAMALARATRYGEWLARPEGAEPSFPVDTARARRALGSAPGERWLSYDAVSEVMAAYGLPMARAHVARSADEAAHLARELGFPVAVKLISDTLTHKTEVGGVRLNLRGPQEVWDAYAGIARKLELSNLAHHMDGVLVQEMIPEGVEVIVGSALDPAFGPLILFGLGGIHVELLKDVAVRVHPLRDVDADEMLSQLKGAALLDGWRGAPPADKQALGELLLRVSQLLGDLPEIVELDINPLKVLPPPLGAIAVDARIRIHL